MISEETKQNPSKTTNKNRDSYVEGIVSIVVNCILFIAKLWAGIITGSIALTADAWHTLSDSISSVVVIVAAKLSSRKADKKHPFGHGRWEQIAALFIAFILAIIAYDFFKDSVLRFSTRETTNFGTIAIVVTIFSILAKEALAQYAFFLARRSKNLSIKADAWHHRSDALSSIIVLIGIFFAKYFWWMDSVLGIIVACMLFFAVFKISKEAITKLLGEKPSADLIEQITDIVKNIYHDDLQLHHFHIHNYVTHQELTFHIKLDNDMSIEMGHKIATNIENIIFQEFNIIATVHIEPLDFCHSSD